MLFRKLLLTLLASCLICAVPAQAERFCYKESETNDHFESLEIRYLWLSENSVRVDVSVWNIEDSVEVYTQVYYGLRPDAPVRPELDDGYEIRVNLLPEPNEDSVRYSLELAADFSRLMIQVSSSKETEHAMMSCGIYHVLSISGDDLDSNSRFGILGPARRAEPTD